MMQFKIAARSSRATAVGNTHSCCRLWVEVFVAAREPKIFCQHIGGKPSAAVATSDDKKVPGLVFGGRVRTSDDVRTPMVSFQQF